MDQNKLVLEEISKGLEMGVQSLEAVKTHIENSEMKMLAEKQENDYRESIAEAHRLSRTLENKKSGNALETAMLKSMIKMKTFFNDKDDHIAEMLIQGSNMLMIELNKIRNDYVSHEAVASYIDRLLKREQGHIDALKPFL